MITVNRSALIVKPKQPFLDWVNSVEPTSPNITLRDVQDEPTIYLVPEIDSDVAPILKVVYKQIFVDQLAAWFTDKECWPQDRSLSVFRQWFDWQSHSMVVDVTDEPLIRERD